MSILELNPITLQDSGEYSCSVVFESLTQHVEVTDVVVNGNASLSLATTKQ